MNHQDRLRKRILAEVLNFLKEHEGRVTDQFPEDVTTAYVRLLQESRRLPDREEFARKAGRIRTRFYRENRRLTKAVVLGGLADRLREILVHSQDLKSMVASMNRVFVSHSNIVPSVYRHFCGVVHSAGYQPVVAEDTPNYGRSWNPGDKAEALMLTCGALVAVITPDDPQTRLPRPNVGNEIGLARGHGMPIVYLKAREAELLSNIRPVYIPFAMAHPEEADDELIANLKSLTAPPPD